MRDNVNYNAYDSKYVMDLNTSSYEFDYFSGSQISIYIGDLLIDDIAHIAFDVRQNKKPIYSYASQYYNVVAPGQVIVSGQFVIPFKEAGYIPIALANFYHKMSAAKNMSPITKKGKNYNVLRLNIERMIQSENTADRFEFYNDLLALSDEEFEGIAERFEDQLWGKGLISNFETPNLQNYEGADPPEATNEFYDVYRRGDQYPPFDIWVLYGDISNKAANHTIKKLLDCEIIGQSQVIQINGEPIAERYDFIGKNLA